MHALYVLQPASGLTRRGVDAKKGRVGGPVQGAGGTGAVPPWRAQEAALTLACSACTHLSTRRWPILVSISMDLSPICSHRVRPVTSSRRSAPVEESTGFMVWVLPLTATSR